ncbi:hypothetical protein BBP00_00009983 [Phytophthora kernoviae]|uniref:Major facilitator superfamily (MFS) profile domain-containing protein n=1 Tax=Phytophthora kernoviae TaxID=325452 RepID=A0A3F2RB05_9STRA|nr:hypothetical protein BBP00_00009983 [Phytophthora kernoviae]
MGCVRYQPPGPQEDATARFFFMAILCLMMAIFWDDLKNQSILFIILYGLTLFFSNFGPNMSTFVLPTDMFSTPIRATCHSISAAAVKAGAAIGSFGFSIWVENESYGYSGAFYTFAAISAISIPLTCFCVHDNTKGIGEMDAQFYQRLNGADDFTRESFNSPAKTSDVSNATPVYKEVATPTMLV